MSLRLGQGLAQEDRAGVEDLEVSSAMVPESCMQFAAASQTSPARGENSLEAARLDGRRGPLKHCWRGKRLQRAGHSRN